VRTAARSLVAALTILSWIAISNHCVVGAITKKAESAHNKCPFHSKPAKQKDPDFQPCCKILRATPTTPAKLLAPAIVDLVHVDLAFAESAPVAPPKFFFAPATLATGPPGKTSFIELIGSVRAHAPPFLS
jgi:hypothetical protein